jgi:hypothetical protein
MRNVRPLLVALLLVPGVLIGIWIDTGSGQGTAPPRPPADAVQQAQTPQAVPSTRPEQQKTPHDQQDPGKNAPPAAATETQPDKGQGLGFDFARDSFNAKRPMKQAGSRASYRRAYWRTSSDVRSAGVGPDSGIDSTYTCS